MGKKIITWKCYIIFCCLTLFTFVSCNISILPVPTTVQDIVSLTQEKVLRNSRFAKDSDMNITEQEIPDMLLSLYREIMYKFNTFSSDVVLISDPFYAVNFLGDGIAGYEEFYNMSIQHNSDAKIYVILEQADNSTHNINIGLLFQRIPLLSITDYLYIKYAKEVIVSPLLKVFAPAQYQAILAIRKNNPIPIKTIAYDEPVLDPHYITVDYTDAIYEMGKLTGKQATVKNEKSPQIDFILGVENIRNVLYRLDFFLRGVFESAPHVQVNYYWGIRKIMQPSNVLSEMDLFSDDSVIYVDSGELTYSIISQYMLNKEEVSILWKDRFFVTTYLWPAQLEFDLPVFARVEVPRDFLFQKKDNIKAVLSRKEK